MITPVTRNGFGVCTVIELNEMLDSGLVPNNITHTDSQKSTDGLRIYMKGNAEGALNFNTKAELDEYIYNNGWVKPSTLDE